MIIYIQNQKELPEIFWELTSEFNKWGGKGNFVQNWPPGHPEKKLDSYGPPEQGDSAKCIRQSILVNHKAWTWALSHHANGGAGTSPTMKADMEVPATSMPLCTAERFGPQPDYSREGLLPLKISMQCNSEKSKVKLWVKCLYFHIIFRIFSLSSWMLKNLSFAVVCHAKIYNQVISELLQTYYDKENEYIKHSRSSTCYLPSTTVILP